MPNQFSHPWTLEEINYLKSNIGRLTYKQMGVVVNRSPSSIQSKIRYLPFQQKVKKHGVNSHFFKKWSPEMAYVLGFIGADGNICHSGRAYTLQIACDDKDVIEKIKLVLGYLGPIHQKPRLNGKISYSLRICDPIIFKDLQALNVTERKSLTFIPPKMQSRYVKHFVRGYFDGDGSVVTAKRNNTSKPKRLRSFFYTASKPMALFLHQVMIENLRDLYKAKIAMKMAHQVTPYYVILLGHHGSVSLFRYMYAGSNLYLERKYQKFLEGVNGD